MTIKVQRTIYIRLLPIHYYIVYQNNNNWGNHNNRYSAITRIAEVIVSNIISYIIHHGINAIRVENGSAGNTYYNKFYYSFNYIII